MRTCPKCKCEKKNSEFLIDNKRENNLSFYCAECTRENGREYYHKNKVLKPVIVPKTKECGNCKKELPRSREFFFTKVYKNKMPDGSIKKHTTLRSACKKCHSILTTEKKRRKRCEELNCTLDEYESIWRKQTADSLQKYNWIDDLGFDITHRRTLIRYLLNGYVFTTVDDYYKERERVKKETFAKKRKFKIPKKYDYLYQMPKNLRNEYQNKDMSDARMANWLGLKLADADPEMIKTKRLLVEINRYIKENPNTLN